MKSPTERACKNEFSPSPTRNAQTLHLTSAMKAGMQLQSAPPLFEKPLPEAAKTLIMTRAPVALVLRAASAHSTHIGTWPARADIYAHRPVSTQRIILHDELTQRIILHDELAQAPLSLSPLSLGALAISAMARTIREVQ